ncbi:MAG TPA: hypothetical protein VK645_20750 [Chitinophagaceae bacterium]|nr:hypothetical protein [Chitinophagaceae bacterium]
MGKAIFRLFLGFIACAAICCSCSKNQVVVLEAVPDPITAVIQDLKTQNPTCICEPYMNQYIWKNENVYVLAEKGAYCNWAPVYYHSNGERFEVKTGYTYDKFLQESQLVKNVWTCL